MWISLNELRNCLTSILLIEGRVEDARERYPDLTDEDFDFLVHNQPAGSNNKYLIWSCDQATDMLENDPDRQALSIIIQSVRLFDGNKQRLEKKDLNQYKDVDELETAVQKLGTSKAQIAKKIRSDTDVIYNDENFTVIRPHTTEASCKYGTGTKWCIAATGSYNYYNQYSSSNNKFYFVIDKKAVGNEPSSKFAIVIIDPRTTGGEAIQVYDALDRLVKLDVVAKHVGPVWNNIWGKINSHVTSNPVTREVEEARKAIEEHVKNMMAGEKMSKDILVKIAKDSNLTTPILQRLTDLIDEDNKTTRSAHDSLAYSLSSTFATRARNLTPEGALIIINSLLKTTRVDDYYLRTIIKDAPLTPDAIRTLVQGMSESFLTAIMGNPNTPDDVIESLVNRIDTFRDRPLKTAIYTRLIKNGTITPAQMIIAMSDEMYLAHSVIEHPELTEKLSPELMRLIPIRNSKHLKTLLSRPNMSTDVALELFKKHWTKFSKHDLYDTLKTMQFPVEMIEKIWSSNQDSHIRVSLLQNPSVGDENIQKFSNSKNSAYRFAIAHNTAATEETLTGLAADESVSTRGAVASNPNTSKTTLTSLANDEAIIVRTNVAGNLATPSDVLNALRKDSDPNVRKTAVRTIKSLTRTESLIRESISLVEAMSDDDETPDIMNPSWREISQYGTDVATFICIYLLQNNGHATREELENAYQAWTGKAGVKDLWHTGRYESEIKRGTTSGGSGWYWAPPGKSVGMQFRLMPAGASVALSALSKSEQPAEPQVIVNSATALEDTTYYIPHEVSGLNITGYETGTLIVERVRANRRGEPIVGGDGQYQKTTKVSDFATKVFKHTSPTGEIRYVTGFPSVTLQMNDAVQFIKPFIGQTDKRTYNSDVNLAMVKKDDMIILVRFPFWAAHNGEQPAARAPNVAPPVKKSLPSPQRTNPTAPTTPTGPREPRTGYKVYGRKGGRPVHTRLKGQAYGGPNNTRFSPGEQAAVSAEDGKLRVKKQGGDDHSQLWDPIDG